MHFCQLELESVREMSFALVPELFANDRRLIRDRMSGPLFWHHPPVSPSVPRSIVHPPHAKMDVVSTDPPRGGGHDWGDQGRWSPYHCTPVGKVLPCRSRRLLTRYVSPALDRAGESWSISQASSWDEELFSDHLAPQLKQLTGSRRLPHLLLRAVPREALAP